MKYRHELKHEITYGDMLVLRRRLSSIMKRDVHATDGKYLVRSLYFDNEFNKALKEKINGVNFREKFRMRYYNGDTSFICLEKKTKTNNLCLKKTTQISAEHAKLLSNCNFDWMTNSNEPLILELYSKIRSQGLRPKTIVDYVREPFVFAPGNVRVTLDYDICTGISCTDFLNQNCATVPTEESPIILEVKWDEYLPDIIRDIIQLPNCRTGSFSKYVACRIYG